MDRPFADPTFQVLTIPIVAGVFVVDPGTRHDGTPLERQGSDLDFCHGVAGCRRNCSLLPFAGLNQNSSPASRVTLPTEMTEPA
jgi:hypothetical protein